MTRVSTTPRDARAVIDADQRALPERAETMAQAIRERYGDAVKALIFYGSGLRETDRADRMLDFYVLVDSYHSVHGRGPMRLASLLAPPSVHYMEIEGPGGATLKSKYSIMSADAFHRRGRGGAFESMIWARFAQPATVSADEPFERELVLETFVLAAAHFASQIAPLMRGETSCTEFWARGLAASYRTELRGEDPDGRAREIVEADAERWTRLAQAIFPASGPDAIVLPDPGAFKRFTCRFRWLLRRVAGKPMGAFRVLKAFFTFENGLDYVLDKLESHTGVRIEVSDGERRRPLLHAPVLAWRLYRRGAFR